MRHFILCDGPRYRLDWWGGGLAYALTHLPSGRSVFAQGDDAAEFVASLAAAELAFPDADTDTVAAWLWDQCGYEMAANEPE